MENETRLKKGQNTEDLKIIGKTNTNFFNFLLQLIFVWIFSSKQSDSVTLGWIFERLLQVKQMLLAFKKLQKVDMALARGISKFSIRNSAFDP